MISRVQVNKCISKVYKKNANLSNFHHLSLKSKLFYLYRDCFTEAKMANHSPLGDVSVENYDNCIDQFKVTNISTMITCRRSS